MGHPSRKVNVVFQVYVELDVSMVPDVPHVIQDMEDYIRDSLEIEYQPDIGVEIDLMELDEYDA